MPTTTLLRPLVAALAAAALALTAAGPASAVAATELKPGTLPRGADIAIPHIEGKSVVDGDLRIRVGGPSLRLLGKSGDSYVVGVRGTAAGRILRVDPDGSTLLIARTSIDNAVLSDDGRRVVLGHWASGRTRVGAWSVAQRRPLTQRTFPGYVTVLDARGKRVLLSSWDRGTFLWRTGDGRGSVRIVTSRVGGEADLSQDLLAAYTGDPYVGGCTVVSSLADPGEVHWRSCGERVEAFSPDGGRMATVGILADGLGPNQAVLRRLGGRAVGKYTVSPGFFGSLSFENAEDLLLDTTGRRQHAVVRCGGGADCELASDAEPSAFPRG